ncbi:hypothetical protein EVAR_22065_1 [Eumeta japonica]|uniref:Uncharacterized protein n=1 Tax=Eumeta variegata TaxID=151549 RepID=A0A4C1USK3_EUMVA|nr:hypothetical protein EVAR_22065_1 [Eumeta japonica]
MDEETQTLLTQWKMDDYIELFKDGRSILAAYKTSGVLDSAGRSKICNLIIKEELKNDPSRIIPSSRMLQWAHEITIIFPKENKATYYLPYINFHQELEDLPLGNYKIATTTEKRVQKVWSNKQKVIIIVNSSALTYYLESVSSDNVNTQSQTNNLLIPHRKYTKAALSRRGRPRAEPSIALKAVPRQGLLDAGTRRQVTRPRGKVEEDEGHVLT